MEESVDIYITVEGSTTPIPGVLVRFFDVSGSVVTEATTDVDGHVGVLLPQGTYTMRFYKFACSFRQPQSFTVVDGVNTFDVRANTLSRPLATDSRMCRCSGYFRNLNGAARPNLDIHLRPQFASLVLEGAAVVPGTLIHRTDARGWLEVDLIRGAIYEASVEELGCTRILLVPDAPRANLPDMLFPVVSSTTFAPTTLALGVGTEAEVTPTVVASSGVLLIGTASADVNWAVDDSSVASVAVREHVVIVTGLAPGSTTLRATRRDTSIIHIPAIGIVGSLPITVS